METGNRPPSAPWMMRVGDVAARLDVKPGTVVRLLNERKLPGIYLGTQNGWRVSSDALEAWIAAQQEGKTPK